MHYFPYKAMSLTTNFRKLHLPPISIEAIKLSHTPLTETFSALSLSSNKVQHMQAAISAIILTSTTRRNRRRRSLSRNCGQVQSTAPQQCSADRTQTNTRPQPAGQQHMQTTTTTTTIGLWETFTWTVAQQSEHAGT